jgi:hypothetical protein
MLLRLLRNAFLVTNRLKVIRETWEEIKEGN